MDHKKRQLNILLNSASMLDQAIHLNFAFDPEELFGNCATGNMLNFVNSIAVETKSKGWRLPYENKLTYHNDYRGVKIAISDR